MKKHEVISPDKDINASDYDDDMASKEVNALASDIDIDKKTKAYQRAENLRDIYGGGLNWIIGVVIFVLVLAILIVAWHYLSPENWRWLKDGDIEKVLGFLFSGAVISAVSLHVQRNL